MKHILSVLALAITASAASAEEAGLKLTEIHMPHHDESARVAIWYPAADSGTTATYAESAVFQGVTASHDAKLAAGLHPVVLFSHGMGGTDRAQAWLGSELARRGAIVVMVNHPNSTWGDFDMSEGVRHWTRAQDLSVALDNLIEDPDFEGHIDRSRILATGFSYGGWTALSLGGMTGNLGGMVEACTSYSETMEACDMLLSDRVGLQRQDPDAWNASYADARVTAVVAIDPGFVWGLNAANASTLLPGAVLVGLGRDNTRMLATNFDRSGLADLLPQARKVQLDPAFHFTAMPLCTPEGADILEAEEDDAVCTDPEGTDRAAVHAEIIEIIADLAGI